MRQPDNPRSIGCLPAACADVIERVRAHSPRVHCITNAVAQNFTANVLLAAGARPSMTISPEEIGSFVASADALLVNLGTFDAVRREATDIALKVAAEESLPWVLDPVLIDRSQPRAAYAADLMTRRPRAVRLNRAEFAALAGSGPDDEALRRYALDARTVIGLTGETDVVSDGARVAAIRNGHALMARVTAMGCVASALVAACHAVEADAWLATAAALLAIGVAGEGAAAHARGPGSFATDILDALYGLDRESLLARAKVQCDGRFETLRVARPRTRGRA
jgi:hydroxyethylthiazole kinase